jgi:chromosome segregation ATPase
VEFDLDDSGDGGSLELAGDDYMAPQTAAVQGIPGLAGDADPGPAPKVKSSLQLADVDEKQPAAAKAAVVSETKEIGDDEVRAIAGFGSPKPGPIGAISYSFKVRGRLKKLAADLEQATTVETAATDRLRTLRADLGRWARDAELTKSDELEALVGRALRAQGELKGAESRRSGLETEHRGKLGRLEQAIAQIEAEARPFRQQEAEASRRLDALRTDRQRAEAKVKRAEIERRNLADLIEKRQAAYADLKKPEAERRQLLADITGFENQLGPVNGRIEQHRAEVVTFDKPVADAEAALTAVRGRVSEKTAQASALRGEVDQLTKEFEQAVGGASAAVDEEQRRSEDAWAGVGAAVYAAGLKGTPLADAGEAVTAAMERSADAVRRVQLLNRAREAFDRRVARQGTQLTVVGAILLLGLIGLAVYLTAF